MKFIERLLQVIKKPAAPWFDPVFGEMTFHMGSWVASTDFPHARGAVEVSVWGSDRPSTFQQNVFQKLLQGYVKLEPELEEALFNEFETTMNSEDTTATDDGFQAEELPENPGEVWKLFDPVSIDIYPEGYSPEYDCRIYYGFPLDIEHNRSVFLQNGKLVFVAPE